MGLLEPHGRYGRGDEQADLSATLQAGPLNMADPTTARVEPNIGPAPVASSMATDELRAAVEPAAPSQGRAAAGSGAGHDQLARIEDKLARIEEKYARSEAILQRGGCPARARCSRWRSSRPCSRRRSSTHSSATASRDPERCRDDGEDAR